MASISNPDLELQGLPKALETQQQSPCNSVDTQDSEEQITNYDPKYV